MNSKNCPKCGKFMRLTFEPRLASFECPTCKIKTDYKGELIKE